MALLHRVRSSGTHLLTLGLVLLAACSAEEVENELEPDAVLQRELNLGLDERVHVIRITGGAVEVADPAIDTVSVGSHVQFTSTDWRVHEVAFELDSMSTAGRTFLEETGQAASPPLLYRDARFLVSLIDAPIGRYPYRLEGNAGPGSGVLIVVDPNAS